MKRLLFLLLFALPVFGQQAIPIQNPSFEVPVNLGSPGSCGAGYWGAIPSWAATQQPGGSFGVIDWTCVPVPDGKAAAFLGNASISQDLGIQPEYGTYILKFWAANWYYNYPAHYDVWLTMGGKPMCHTGSYAIGDFQEVTLTCLVPGYISNDHHLGFTPGNLGILVTATEWALLVDKFLLTFTPVN